MEMEMAVQDEIVAASLPVEALIARLNAAAGLIEQAAERMAGHAVEIEARATTREAELEQQLAEAGAVIAALKQGRRTLPAGVTSLLAKDASSGSAGFELGALDAALTSLSPEQRIAVKSQLMRSGLIG